MATTTTTSTSTTSTTTTTLLLDDGMTGHWTMDTAHIYGTTIRDQSGAGNDAEMSGDPVAGTCGVIINVVS